MREPLRLGNLHPETGAQVRGPVWRGRLPRRPHYTQAHPLESSELGFGVAPGSSLARLLMRLARPERRLVLAAVQSPNPVRRRKLEREVNQRFHRLGIHDQ